MTAKNTKELVRLHKASRVTGILQELESNDFLEKFYTRLIKNSESQLTQYIESSSGVLIGALIPINKNCRINLVDLDFKSLLRIIKLVISKPKILSRIVIYFIDEKILPLKMPASYKNIYEIQILLVEQIHQNQGIGSIMIHKFVSSLPNGSYVIVKTYSKLAEDFYLKHGFNYIRSIKIGSKELRSFNYRKDSLK